MWIDIFCVEKITWSTTGPISSESSAPSSQEVTLTLPWPPTTPSSSVPTPPVTLSKWGFSKPELSSSPSSTVSSSASPLPDRCRGVEVATGSPAVPCKARESEIHANRGHILGGLLPHFNRDCQKEQFLDFSKSSLNFPKFWVYSKDWKIFPNFPGFPWFQVFH